MKFDAIWLLVKRWFTMMLKTASRAIGCGFVALASEAAPAPFHKRGRREAVGANVVTSLANACFTFIHKTQLITDPLRKVYNLTSAMVQVLV